jgi:hypothetical protein
MYRAVRLTHLLNIAESLPFLAHCVGTEGGNERCLECAHLDVIHACWNRPHLSAHPNPGAAPCRSFYQNVFNPTSWLDDIFRTYRSEAPALRMKNEKKKEGIYESTYDLVINK